MLSPPTRNGPGGTHMWQGPPTPIQNDPRTPCSHSSVWCCRRPLLACPASISRVALLAAPVPVLTVWPCNRATQPCPQCGYPSGNLWLGRSLRACPGIADRGKPHGTGNCGIAMSGRVGQRKWAAAKASTNNYKSFAASGSCQPERRSHLYLGMLRCIRPIRSRSDRLMLPRSC